MPVVLLAACGGSSVPQETDCQTVYSLDSGYTYGLKVASGTCYGVSQEIVEKGDGSPGCPNGYSESPYSNGEIGCSLSSDGIEQFRIINIEKPKDETRASIFRLLDFNVGEANFWRKTKE